jgi:aspartyl-tRNA(Asn)/glutamyl-tRNA(Gln) amidotransferase subunit B
MDYEATIGLETHVQLRTRTKIWCGCRNRSDSEPNEDVCPVCLGYPGTLPVLNEEAVRLTVLTGLMLGCRINTFTKWDRKSYFYPDMPKNYQISQYDLPLCEAGGVPIAVDGVERTVRLTRIHLEEDVGKSTHVSGGSLLDFNRAGTPLMEIVTEPDLHTPDETFAYLQALKQILTYGEVSDCNLELGNIRCDVNCSVRPVGQEALGTKTEIKNMNTFKGVYRALKYEIKRQVAELEKGGVISQETRRWDDEAGATVAMRSKEFAHDYRYLPEPDLVPVVLSAEQLEAWRKELPELPAQRRERMVAQYGLPEYDAGVLAADKAIADFYEEAAGRASNAKAVSNWVMTELLRALSESEQALADTKLTPAGLASLVDLVENKTINANTAKDVFNELFAQGGDPAAVVEARGLAQVSDTGAIDEFVSQAVEANAKSVADYKAGKKAALQYLVGQVMRLSKGKANPQLAAEAIKARLG